MTDYLKSPDQDVFLRLLSKSLQNMTDTANQIPSSMFAPPAIRPFVSNKANNTLGDTFIKPTQTLAEDASYGMPLYSGKGMTFRPDERFIDALGLASPAIKPAGLAAKAIGKTTLNELLSQIESGTGMVGRNVINPRTYAIDHPFLKPSGILPENATSAEKSAYTKYQKALENKAFARRETMREAGQSDVTKSDIGQRTVIQPESLLGKTIVPVVGDVSETGLAVRNIEGVPLNNTVLGQGGEGYSLQHKNLGTGNAWASMYNAASGKQLNFNKAREATGQDVVGVYSAMSPEGSMNFSLPISESIVRQIDVLKPRVADIKLANQDIQKALHAKDKNIKFVGLTDDRVYDQLQQSGDLRKSIVEILGKTKFQNLGFPNVEDINKTFKSQALGDVKLGDSGYTMFNADPSGKLNPVSGHLTYDTGILGNYIGGLEKSAPAEIMFPKIFDYTGKLMTKPQGAGAPRPYSKTDQINALRTSHLYEPVDQQWLDNYMQWLEKSKKGLL
jgi:hypothetical protein